MLNVIFARKLVRTPIGRLASRILAQWAIQFPDLPTSSTIDRFVMFIHLFCVSLIIVNFLIIYQFQTLSFKYSILDPNLRI